MALPAIYLPHGGGPWPFIDLPAAMKQEYVPLESYLRSLIASLPERPRALLMISAHWEEPTVTLMTNPHPPLLYDYSGFPPAAYNLKWPAPTAADLVPRVHALLDAAGILVRDNAQRGFDHGTFVPMMLVTPEANIPILQMSLLGSLDPAAHIALGRALAPLRDEGVLIIGSGVSYHNMRGFGQPSAVDSSRQFDEWLGASVALDRNAREERLRNWKQAPAAALCHPREEHLLPLHVIAGAARDDAGAVTFRGTLGGCAMSAVQFG